MERNCVFLKDFIDKENGKLIWQKKQEYLITYEDDENIYFGKPIASGISKKLEGEYFVTRKNRLNEED